MTKQSPAIGRPIAVWKKRSLIGRKIIGRGDSFFVDVTLGPAHDPSAALAVSARALGLEVHQHEPAVLGKGIGQFGAGAQEETHDEALEQSAAHVPVGLVVVFAPPVEGTDLLAHRMERSRLQVVQQERVEDVVPANVRLVGRKVGQLETTFQRENAGLHAPAPTVQRANKWQGQRILSSSVVSSTSISPVGNVTRTSL